MILSSVAPDCWAPGWCSSWLRPASPSAAPGMAAHRVDRENPVKRGGVSGMVGTSAEPSPAGASRSVRPTPSTRGAGRTGIVRSTRRARRECTSIHEYSSGVRISGGTTDTACHRDQKVRAARPAATAPSPRHQKDRRLTLDLLAGVLPRVLGRGPAGSGSKLRASLGRDRVIPADDRRPSDALLKGLRGAAPAGADATDDGAILHEILRLEPVVGELQRMTRAPLTVETATGRRPSRGRGGPAAAAPSLATKGSLDASP